MQILDKKPIHVFINELAVDTQRFKVSAYDPILEVYREHFQRFGFLAPILIEEIGMVIEGETRIRVYLENGLKAIPAYRVKFDTIKERELIQTQASRLSRC